MNLDLEISVNQQPSGVTTTPATPAMQVAANCRIYCFLTKNRPIRQKNETYLGQLSDASTRKNILGTKSSRGWQRGYKGAPKILLTFFNLFLLDTKVFGYKKLQGAPKRSAGAPNGNFTPLQQTEACDQTFKWVPDHHQPSGLGDYANI